MTLLAPCIGNDVSYVTQISDDIHFAWQEHYLVMLERLYLLRAVEMTFHMSRGSLIKFILRGRRSIW